jgi:hypothetical protein
MNRNDSAVSYQRIFPMHLVSLGVGGLRAAAHRNRDVATPTAAKKAPEPEATAAPAAANAPPISDHLVLANGPHHQRAGPPCFVRSRANGLERRQTTSRRFPPPTFQPESGTYGDRRGRAHADAGPDRHAMAFDCAPPATLADAHGETTGYINIHRARRIPPRTADSGGFHARFATWAVVGGSSFARPARRRRRPASGSAPSIPSGREMISVTSGHGDFRPWHRFCPRVIGWPVDATRG